jgi:hypothetical protein
MTVAQDTASEGIGIIITADARSLSAVVRDVLTDAWRSRSSSNETAARSLSASSNRRRAHKPTNRTRGDFEHDQRPPR